MKRILKAAAIASALLAIVALWMGFFDLMMRAVEAAREAGWEWWYVPAAVVPVLCFIVGWVLSGKKP